MSEPPEIAALTLAEAAAALGVRPQRISQMLSNGDLRGPAMGPGRAPKGVGRVWRHEIEREIRDRESERRPRRAPRGRDPHAGASAREATAVEAALRMKIGLDEARRMLKEERQKRKRLVSMLADAVAEIGREQADGDSFDIMAEAYSEALTQLLTPDQPTE
jgi:hypothetical protein